MPTPDTKSLLRDALGLEDEHTPFPWQERLLDLFERRNIPPALDIPTGLGKTAIMAIWLVARIGCSDLPRRLVYVVDRRAIVDQATETAERLREWVNRNQGVRSALGLNDRSLPISTLRGRYVDNREWLEDPAVPAIIVGTVDMIGSRLLFHGYGVSRKMRPYHAGLLGIDSLVVLDEAHLVPPFERLLRSIAQDASLHPRDEYARRIAPPLKVITLSATGRQLPADCLKLDDSDRRHPVAAKRLSARKALYISELEAEQPIAQALAEHAWSLCDKGRARVRVLVFSDSRKDAHDAKRAFDELLKKAKKHDPNVSADVELFVGGRRIFERDRARERLAEMGFLPDTNGEPNTPSVLFATSAAEVGVDLDADHMVCDLVPWERMVQRLGRVNRRGDRDDTRVHLLVQPPSDADKKANTKHKAGEELKDSERAALQRFRMWCSTQKLCQELPPLSPSDPNGPRDASPVALSALRDKAQNDASLAQALEDATTPEPLYPPLRRATVDAWALTSLDVHPARMPVQPWLRGWVEDPPQTVVLWRRHLPVREEGPPVSKTEINRFFEAAPPHTSELLEIETDDAAKWLTRCVRRLLKTQPPESSPAGDDSLSPDTVAAIVLNPDGTFSESLSLQQLGEAELKDLKGLLRETFLVLDARVGGLDPNGLLDHKVSSIPITADSDEAWHQTTLVPFRVRTLDTSSPDPHATGWRERFRLATRITVEGEVLSWLVVENYHGDSASEDDRSAGPPQLLEDHTARVVQHARALTRALNLPDTYQSALELAARFHDEGKRSWRWQRAFNAPLDTREAYAKAPGPINFSLLDGYRHELGSLLRLESQYHQSLRALPEEHLRDLALHLVVAHHGFARPVIPLTGCDDAPPSALEARAMDIALRFARLSTYWGPWALAWWESLLRSADQRASQENEALADNRSAA